VDKTRPSAFRSFSGAVRIDLANDPSARAEDMELGYRVGSRALKSVLDAMREDGTHHVMLNVMPTGRPAADMLAEIADAIF
jgi:hypothetical protein